ncbi:hypothetical protein [Palleronia caenipelagi]|uniref:Uncharacterized protein n=1 Tax=Palleronia caenipelagi TaxID=2489174 RepID=A0A547PM20_9RHOB|nr:hypothetical protein [Palleronia caenipelagi]TRD15192.1 hypothetical protein FEV53_17545 [Palleronia caenipelagi]
MDRGKVPHCPETGTKIKQLARPELRSGSPFQAIKDWRKLKSELFGRQLYYPSGFDGNAVQGGCALPNAYMQMIADHSRIARHKVSVYGQRSRVAAQIDRYRQMIGPKPRDRNMESHATKFLIVVKTLNRMIDLGHVDNAIVI